MNECKEQIEQGAIILGRERMWETKGEDFGWSRKLAGGEVSHGNDEQS
jgi:hypothetical protein